jgi:hypothetical protein
MKITRLYFSLLQEQRRHTVLGHHATELIEGEEGADTVVLPYDVIDYSTVRGRNTKAPEMQITSFGFSSTHWDIEKKKNKGLR